MKKQTLMRPIIDFTFKKIFAGNGNESKIILMNFLNAVLDLKDEKAITEITYLNPYNDKEYKYDKMKLNLDGVFTPSKF